MRAAILLGLLGILAATACRSRADRAAEDSGQAAFARWTVPTEVTGQARGLVYRVRHELAPDTLTSTLALTNRGEQPVHLEFGACSLELFLHAAGDSLGVAPPLFRSDAQRAANLPAGAIPSCPAYLAAHDVAPGATLEAREFVTWSLPGKAPLTTLAPGSYAAVLRLALLGTKDDRAVQETLVVPAGTFVAR